MRIGATFASACVGLLLTAGSAGAQSISDLTRGMDAVVQLDSRGWWANRYDVGSMHNVSVRSESNYSTAYGDYTYNGGVPGWVRMRYVGEQISCIEFHDFAGNCRPVGENPARQMVGALLVAGAVGAMSAPSSSSAARSSDNGFAEWRADQNIRRDCVASGSTMC